jgi:Rrf2 family transcriptional regulator, iron-sulfur cluster assembly transcription factor
MGFLAQAPRDEPVLARTIAKQMQIPGNFLSKIMHRLVREGLVDSTRGTGGGFTLTRDPQEIFLIEVAAPFMDFSLLGRCFLGRTECDGACGIHSKWKPVQEKFETFLKSNTIADVL